MLLVAGFVAVFVAFFSGNQPPSKPDIHHALSMLIGSVLALIVSLVPLVVAAYGKEVSVSRADIGSIAEMKFFRPHRVTVRFDRPSPFGPAIAFFPPLQLGHWSYEHPNTRALKEWAAQQA